jgi:amidohydrolase
MDAAAIAREIQPQLIAWRRDLHQMPEPGLATPDTAAYVAEQLRRLGLEVRTGVGGHGVVALLKGGKPGKTLAIRSDMDALLVAEDTGLPFASKRPGKMHACGHDAHMAMTLGAAALLAQRRADIAGAVKFIFQPGEEGPGGAKPMIDDGCLDSPKVDGIIGLHIGNIWPSVPLGHVGVKPGAMMACLDRIDVTIKGKGGHGAMPQHTVDAISIACHAVSTLQTVVAREVNPCESAVVTIGKLTGGSAYNVITGEVVMEGTCRAFRQELREFLNQRIGSILRGVAEGMRGTVEYKYTYGYPPTCNDPAFTGEFAAVARDVLGAEKVVELSEPTMGGEDFAYYLQRVPGTFFFLAGCNAAKGQTVSHHHPKFTIDEDVLWEGTALFTAFAMKWLGCI